MHRENLIYLLNNYNTEYTEEKSYKEQILSFISNNEIIFGKSNKSGHITASTWIVNKDRTKVLLTHHFKLDMWVQLGGHTDEDESVLQGAFREAKEESGLEDILVLSEEIFDVDVHKIPQYKGTPDHIHYDVRFLFQGNSEENPKVSSESKDVKWISVEDICNYTQERSVLRMVEKTK